MRSIMNSGFKFQFHRLLAQLPHLFNELIMVSASQDWYKTTQGALLKNLPGVRHVIKLSVSSRAMLEIE